MSSLLELEVGDITYAKVQSRGLSYEYVFARCTKVLPSGKYRLQSLKKVTGPTQNVSWDSWTPVKPSDNVFPGTFLIDKNGYQKKVKTFWGYFYEKYTHDLQLKDYLCGGD